MGQQQPGGMLHPLDVGGAFSAGWRLFRARWRVHLAVLITVLVPGYLLNGLWILVYGEVFERWAVAVQAAQLGGRPLGDAALPPLPLDGLLIALALNLAVAFLGVLGTAAVVNVLGWTYGGGAMSAGRALRAVARRWTGLLGASLLFALAVIGVVLVGFVLGAMLFAIAGPTGGLTGLLALIVVVGTVVAAAFLILRWIFAIHVVALEGRGARDALRRSWLLVSGSTWRMLGYLLLLILLLIAAGLVVGLIQTVIFGLGFDPLTGELWPFDPVRAVGGSILQAAVTIALTPYYLAVLTLLYYDLRWRRGEALQPPPG